MPLALLLHETFGAWQRDVARLSGWNRLVDLEDTLVGRARGTFLARWFGVSLPMFGNGLSVAIANIDELTARVATLRAQAAGSGRSLAEPLAGITGTMVGALLAPTSSMVLMLVVAEQMPNWITTLAAALNWLTLGGLGMLLFAIGVPVSAVGMPLAAVAGREKVGAAAGFLEALADLFASSRGFLEQLLGPRDQVRNPLLAQVLGVLDDLATLVPFVFALCAFVVLSIGPVLGPLAGQLGILIPMARDVFAILKSILSDLFDRLREVYAGEHSPWSILSGVISTLSQWLTLLVDGFLGLFKIAAPAFDTVPAAGSKDGELRAWSYVKRVLDDAFKRVRPFVRQMTTGNWLVARIKEIADRLSHIASIVKDMAAPDTKKKAPPTLTERLEEYGKKIVVGALPPWPDTLRIPKTPDISDMPSASNLFEWEKNLAMRRKARPDVAAALAKPGGGSLFTLGRDGERSLKGLHRAPVDVFGAERSALLDSQKPASEARAEETALRSMLFTVIDALLPEAVTAQVPKLQALLWEIDDKLYGPEAFPVRDLPGGDRLSLKVGRLRVRAPGMKETEVRAWGRTLKIALANEVYRTDRAVPA